MKHAAAVLLLVTMAAAPVTTTACIGWCFPTTAPTTTACQHELAMLGIKDADDSCDSVLDVSPFIREEIQLTMQAVLPATPLSLFVRAAGDALLASGRDIDTALARQAISPLVLRL